jgi:trigger factor
LEDARDMLKEKAGELTYADDILKRWLLVANEKTTPEKVEHDFPQVLNDLGNHLIREKLVKDNNITVEEADLYDFAQKVAKAQFAQYGMLSVPEDALDKYTKDMLKHKETRQNIIDRVVESKLAAWLKSQVTLDIKEVTPDEFNKLFVAE